MESVKLKLTRLWFAVLSRTCFELENGGWVRET